jgi:hypothetical protein
MFERFHPLAFLFSGIGFILAFLAVAVGLGHALHVPDFMTTIPHVARDMENVLGSNWPQILMDMGRILFIVLMLPAAVCISLGRRHLGARHLIRGVLGLGGLVAAILMLADGMYWGFRRGVPEAGFTEFGQVLERVLKGLQSEGAFFAAVIFVASVVILSWPARQKSTVLTPALNQGIS